MLTTNLILQKISQEDICRKYILLAGGEYQINKQIGNPFRADNHKNSAVFYYDQSNTLRYCDHANANYKGDCFDLVGWYLKAIGQPCNFLDVLKEIDKSFNLGISPSGFDTKNIKPNDVNNSLQLSAKTFSNNGRRYSTQFRTIDFLHFTFAHTNYVRSYFIDPKDLKKFKVFPVKQFHYGQINLYKSWNHDERNPIFKYQIIPYKLNNRNQLVEGTETYIQIYRPLAKRKRDKFRTDAKGSPLMNFHNIFENKDINKDFVFITSSMKDVMVLDIFNIPAVCPVGEGTNIPHYYLDYLEQNFKNVVINYDSDEAGIAATNQLLKKRPNFFTFYVDEKFKDISEFVRARGVSEVSNVLNTFTEMHFNLTLCPF